MDLVLGEGRKEWSSGELSWMESENTSTGICVDYLVSIDPASEVFSFQSPGHFFVSHLSVNLYSYVPV